jgi:hypothetical protein
VNCTRTIIKIVKAGELGAGAALHPKYAFLASLFHHRLVLFPGRLEDDTDGALLNLEFRSDGSALISGQKNLLSKNRIILHIGPFMNSLLAD